MQSREFKMLIAVVGDVIRMIKRGHAQAVMRVFMHMKGIYRRMKSCFESWRKDEQRVAAIFLIVALLEFIWKVCNLSRLFTKVWD